MNPKDHIEPFDDAEDWHWRRDNERGFNDVSDTPDSLAFDEASARGGLAGVMNYFAENLARQKQRELSAEYTAKLEKDVQTLNRILKEFKETMASLEEAARRKQ